MSTIIMIPMTIFLCAMLTACGNSTENVRPVASSDVTTGPAANTASPQTDDEKEVTLTIWTVWKDYPSDDDFNNVWVKAVESKYPNIHLNLVRRAAGTQLTELVTANMIPDITIESILSGFQEERDLELLYDMTPLIKKYDFDMNRIMPEVIKQTEVHPYQGVYGMPYTLSFNATYYNKDIFDKFGVDYPQDLMTWEDAIVLGRELTRESDGIQYRGLNQQELPRLAYQLGYGYIDLETNKPVLDKWKPAYELFYQILSIPGNMPEKPINVSGQKYFLVEQIAAMWPYTNQLDMINRAGLQNWDMVTFPQNKLNMGTYGASGGKAFLITSTSKNKDAAFKFIQTLMSDEMQAKFTRIGNLSPLVDTSFESDFGADLPWLQGKNISSIYKLNQGFYPISEYDKYVRRFPSSTAFDIFNGEDINTVIRKTTEMMDQALQTNIK